MSEAPQTRAQVWRQFWLWVAGVPAVFAAALAVIWLALWISGGDMVWQAVSSMGTALFWLAAIALLYPVMLWVWVGELRDGLTAAAQWEQLSEAERAAFLAAVPVKPGRRRKVAGGRA